ncbi:hypothetical protein GGS21DRAFT_533874 [Xylaria nigripes]|nr:hypothetical protein GGS21DRAFT_533874 [Xylaria nigripes]
MFYTQVIGKNGKDLGRIALRAEMDDRPMSPCSIMSIDSFEPTSSQIRQHRDMPISFSIPECEPRRERRINTASPVQGGLRRRLLMLRARESSPVRSYSTHHWEGSGSDTMQEAQAPATTATTPPSPGYSNSDQSELEDREDQLNSSDSRRKSRDITSNLKYLVRGFLRQFRADASASANRKLFASREYFVHSPKVTFLIDEPDTLLCQICQRTPLKMAITAALPAPDMTAILPCGHISCYGCIKTWLDEHTSCPFCRTDLTYTDCSHQVQPRIIAQDTIHTLPETLARGGEIGEQCFGCTEKSLRKISLQRWAALTEDFLSARHEAEMLGTDDAVENMNEAQKAFEQLPEDDHWALTRLKLHQW